MAIEKTSNTDPCICVQVKWRHVHCRICKKITSESPCALCHWRDRVSPHIEEELEF